MLVGLGIGLIGVRLTVLTLIAGWGSRRRAIRVVVVYFAWAACCSSDRHHCRLPSITGPKRGPLVLLYCHCRRLVLPRNG